MTPPEQDTRSMERLWYTCSQSGEEENQVSTIKSEALGAVQSEQLSNRA